MEVEPHIMSLDLDTNATFFEISDSDLLDLLGIEDPVEMQWADSIQEHYLKVICGVGLPGNLAAMVTIATLKPFSSATFLVALLAASDSVALLLKTVINQLYYVLDSFNDHYCRCYYLVNVMSSYANWVLVLMALERLVAVTFPMARHRYLSKHRTYFICLWVFLGLLAVHAPMVMRAVPAGKLACGVKEDVKEYARNALVWLNSLLYAMLPVLLLMVITLLLSFVLHRASRQRRHLQGGRTPTPAEREARRSERAITAMMLSAAVLFLLLVLPQCVYFLLVHHSTTLEHVRYTPADHLARQVTTVLADSTHALNFYLYFVSVRRFRHRFLALLTCRAGPCGRRTPGPGVRSSVSRSTGRSRSSRSPNDRRWVFGGGSSGPSTQYSELTVAGTNGVGVSPARAGLDPRCPNSGGCGDAAAPVAVSVREKNAQKSAVGISSSSARV